MYTSDSPQRRKGHRDFAEKTKINTPSLTGCAAPQPFVFLRTDGRLWKTVADAPLISEELSSNNIDPEF
jgi:hypothetical protein